MSDDDTDPKHSRQDPAPSLVEWMARGLSALIVLALFGFLLHGALQPEIGPNFALDVHTEKIEQRRNGWAVPMSITNKGTVAIADVFYEIVAPDRSQTVKRGRIAIFGAGETVESEVWFDEKPASSQFELRVDTYTL